MSYYNLIAKRLCSTMSSKIGCAECPLNILDENKIFHVYACGIMGDSLEDIDPKRYYKILDDWYDKNPLPIAKRISKKRLGFHEVAHRRKTLLERFREQFPKAPLDKNGFPLNFCPSDLGYKDIGFTEHSCSSEDCFRCWNQFE